MPSAIGVNPGRTRGSLLAFGSRDCLSCCTSYWYLNLSYCMPRRFIYAVHRRHKYIPYSPLRQFLFQLPEIDYCYHSVMQVVFNIFSLKLVFHILYGSVKNVKYQRQIFMLMLIACFILHLLSATTEDTSV